MVKKHLDNISANLPDNQWLSVKCVQEKVGENEMYLLVRVAEIRGNCPVYKVGDSFRLEDGYRLVSESPLCMHSLAALLPHYNALRISEPEQWGLAGKEDN
jgi:uncharacterized repeat protein (TIGR04076 family)